MIGRISRRVPFLLPALSLSILALPGCMANQAAPLPPAGPQHHAAPPGCTDGFGSLAPLRWWECLGDAQLSTLIESGLATAPSPASAQDRLAAEIASRYIALRAQQTALVLLADQAELDGQRFALARQRFAPRRTVAAAMAQLSDTLVDQARTRTEIAALRVRLAVLAGSALGALTAIPGGPIPLSPPMLGPGDAAALKDYRAAVAADAAAQAVAMAARAAAARETLRATGAPTPGEVLDAESRALAALRCEEQARAAMAQAYVALVRSRWLSSTNRRHSAVAIARGLP